MAAVVERTKENIRRIVTEAFYTAIAAGDIPEGDIPSFLTEIPADRKNGDFAVNAAMAGARIFRMPPRVIAEKLLAAIIKTPHPEFVKIEVAGAGFLNFYTSPSYRADIIKEILSRDADYGRSKCGGGQRVMVEFVSANPTGPMHIGNARGGAVGDCLASVLDAAGYEVSREFYVNDAGNQIQKFAVSLEARYLQIYKPEFPFPEDGYKGADITSHAEAFAEIHGNAYVNSEERERRDALVAYALPLNLVKMRDDLERYKITYDKWYHESVLHESGAVAETIALLTEKGMTYEKDGAVWYKATAMGGEKDEVLVRQGGIPTYFAADIAYHKDKFDRGFDLCIDVWGADHHGHVARMKGALDAIGLDGSKLTIVLMQLVKLVRDDEIVKMSKRSGNAIQLSDLLDQVSPDAARFFFNLQATNTQMEFDVGLAVQQDSQNPVYYVQYAHARICSIIRRLEEEGITLSENVTSYDLLTAPEELDLICELAGYTDEIIAASKSYDPSKITKYTIGVATSFHKFYNSCRVKGDDPDLTQARLALCTAARIVIRNALALLKISTPEKM